MRNLSLNDPSFLAAVSCLSVAPPTISVGYLSTSADNPIIYGWSGNRPDGNTQADDDPSAPWHGRKWKRKTFTVAQNVDEIISIWSGAGGCGAGGTQESSETRYCYLNGVYSDMKDSGGTSQSGSVTLESYAGAPSTYTPSIGYDLAGLLYSSCYSPSESPPGTITIVGYGSTGSTLSGTITRSLTSEIALMSGVDTACSSYLQSELSALITSRVDLLEEDTLGAAILRNITGTGTSYCAITGIATDTTPGGDGQIEFEPSTSIILPVSITGAPFRSYVLRFTFHNYIHSTNTPLADSTEDITISTDASGVGEVDYQIEQPSPDRRRCYASLEYVSSP